MIILVDGDNIGCNAWVFLLTALTENDGLILFYTDKSPSLTIGTLEKIINSEYPMIFVHCQMGTNALDFQLSSYLGFLIAQEPHKEYAILSNDNGYDVVVSFWKRSGYAVKQIRSTDLQEMKRSFLRLTTMDNPLEELETFDMVEDSYTAVDSLPDESNGSPVILYDQNSQKAIFHELLFIFSRKPSPINVAINYLGMSSQFSNQLNILNTNGSAFSKVVKEFSSESREKKVKRFLRLVAERNNLELTDNCLDFIVDSWLEKESLTSFRMRLLNRFPDGVGEHYYSSFKEIISLLANIK